MAEVTITLPDGLKIGDSTFTEAVLRDPTVGDMLEATQAAERLHLTPDGWQLITSPSLLGALILGRQVVRIGDHPGPLLLPEIKKLSARDFSLLQDAAQTLEGTATQSAEAATARGRDRASSK